MAKMVETKEFLGWSGEQEQACITESPDEPMVPVRPSDEGRYGSYEAYRNENRKIDSRHRKDYAFPFVDGTYGIVKPGDVSPMDGKTVTKEDIALLHRERDNEVYHNNRYRHKNCEDYDLLEQMDFEYEKKRRGLPNRYEELEGIYNRQRLVIDQGALPDDGEAITQKMFCCAHIPTPEEALGLNEDPLADEFAGVIQTLTKEEWEVFDLVWIKGNARTTVAKILGVSEGTVRYRLNKIKAKIGENPIIMSFVDLTGTEKERRDAWVKAQKEKKRKYEQDHKDRLKRWAEGAFDEQTGTLAGMDEGNDVEWLDKENGDYA